MTASCEHGFLAGGPDRGAKLVGPPDGKHLTALCIEFEIGIGLFWRPDADEALLGAAGEVLFIWIPLDLRDILLVALPHDQRLIRLVDRPKVNEFTLAGDGDVFGALPFYFDSFEILVDVLVVEDGHVSAFIGLGVPDKDLAHETSRCDESVVLRAELALHEVLVEHLHVSYLDLALSVDLAETSYHVRARRDELVASLVPVDRAHVSLLYVIFVFDMRDLNMFEIAKVVSAQIIHARYEAASRRGKEAVFRVELGEVDVPALSILRRLP